MLNKEILGLEQFKIDQENERVDSIQTERRLESEGIYQESLPVANDESQRAEVANELK